ncbi:uncharacterized protein TRUGW13939_03411 [Talaromyces rugulosus]|uniref:Uncharacterized protein n=1 Tax=Talaromyces rugulosus TaxID=121627 RepID=A0A7H8QQS2_TALRU|nr:uncharacterized protein TRUGW13939_03411 [Talaromyces rugulosus]QKX56310.1 hypothetical protein TRUGW13939_03411 [Talaromyces rugulosus]
MAAGRSWQGEETLWESARLQWREEEEEEEEEDDEKEEEQSGSRRESAADWGEQMMRCNGAAAVGIHQYKIRAINNTRQEVARLGRPMAMIRET